jgi:hypothetical protein
MTTDTAALHTGLAHLVATRRPAAVQADWTRNTPLLECDHPRVRVLALRLTQLLRSPREKAVACFEHVRRLPFACAWSPCHASAPDVIAAGRGDTYTKSTLLVALLRACDIPARVRALRVDAAPLRGIALRDRATAVHVVTEVLLPGGAWQRVDAYAMDPLLDTRLRIRLLREHRASGWGLHVHGARGWTGQGDALTFLGCSCEPACEDLGCFDDVRDFLRNGPAHARPASGGLASFRVNRRLRDLRGNG